MAPVCDCGAAHPSALTAFIAIDLLKSGPTIPVSSLLTDLFSPASSLMKDFGVQAALGQTSPSHWMPSCGHVRLRHFAFYDYQASIGGVRLSLSYIEESNPSTESSLKIALASAKEGRHGVLTRICRESSKKVL
jgi:hypothetical protein